MPNSGEFAGEFTYQEFVMQSDGLGGSQALTTYLMMLPPRPLAVVDGDAAGGLFLVTLVDDRYIRRFYDIGANVATCSAATSTDTWAGLMNWYCVNLGFDGFTLPTISSVYGQPEPDSPLYGASEPNTLMIDAVAANCGGFITLDYDVNYVFQSWNAALAARSRPGCRRPNALPAA